MQPPPAPRKRSKIDTLIFTSDSAKATKVEEIPTASRDSLPTPRFDVQGIRQDMPRKEIEVVVEVENVERPVDLYKVLSVLKYLTRYFIRYFISRYIRPDTVLASLPRDI